MGVSKAERRSFGDQNMQGKEIKRRCSSRCK
jgi:hypothetical protein